MTNKFAAAVLAASLVASFAFAAENAAPVAGCSDTTFTTKDACEAAKGTWTEAAAPAAK